MAPNIRELSPELQERAIKELHEVPERREQDIAAIREWLKKQPHILAKPDDQLIIAFLRGCKFSLERTKEKMDLYYTMRTALPEFFKGRDFKDKVLNDLLEVGANFPVPDLDANGYRVYVMRIGYLEPSVFKMEDFMKMLFMMQDYVIREDDQAVIAGGVNLMDMAKLSMGHLTQMNPTFVKKASITGQDAYPFRPKGMNFINTPSIFDTLFKLINSFSRDKLKKRTFVHGENYEALYKNIPQHMLPSEYGGKAGTIKEINDEWIAKLRAYNDWFLSPEGYLGVDESKRPGKPKTHQDLFGIEGSFRQLSVD